MEKAEVSVITVMRDEWALVELLGENLASWCTDWHIVLTDDANEATSPSEEFTTRFPFARFHEHPLKLGASFDSARAIPLSVLANDWVLILDTDERIWPEVVERVIAESVRDPHVSGFWMARQNHVLGVPMHAPAFWPDWQMRFVRKDAVHFPDGIHKKYEIRGKTKYLEESEKFAIFHYSFRSTHQFLDKIQTYTTIEAETGNTLPASPIQALWPALRYFLVSMLKMRAAEDGDAGVHMIVCWTFYRYIAHVKAWEMAKAPPHFPEPEVR